MSNEHESIRWGIIGPGGIAHQFAQALAQTQGGELYAVASRNKARAEDFAQQYAAEISYGNYQEIVSDPSVDVIYIATPHSHHFQHAQACLDAGKHVLMEKPLTVTAQQTQALVALSKGKGCVFQEALWSRYMPCFAKVKTWIDSGEIGELQYITSQIGFAFSHLRNHRLTLPELAGGAILDLGVYSTSISQYLIGSHPTKVQAMGMINEDGVDQNTLVNLRHPGNIHSQFTCTIGAQCSNVMTIHGKKGYILLPHCFWNGNSASLYKDDRCVATENFPHPINGFEYQIASTMESIVDGRLCDPRMSHEDSIGVMKTLDEIRQQIGLAFPDNIESCD
ncbi:MAG: Gfo/Idh/MocA family oxidoreductase [Aliiglaciecola sp.]